MQKKYIDLLQKRRSRYFLKNEAPLTTKQIEDLVKDVVKYTPTSFNSQTTRAVLLFGKEHEAFWMLTLDEIKKVIPEGQDIAPTETKLNWFKNSFGTVLFYEDLKIVEDLKTRFPLYKEFFLDWAHQASAMAQLGVWTAFAENGIGASLQHYNPVIDDAVRSRFKIPETWEFIGQMPFGAYDAPDADKEFAPIDKRVYRYQD